MTLNLSLSTESIDAAVRQLQSMGEDLEDDVEQFVEVMANEGAEVAQSAYGNWNVQAVAIPDGTQAEIIVAGDMPLIAEFGAGDATLDPKTFFENSPETPVFPGSYSLFEGSREYYNFGSWRMPYTNLWLTQVAPRHGLFNAKLYLLERSTDIAREVIQLD